MGGWRLHHWVAVIGGLFAAAAATALILPQHIAVRITTMLAFMAPMDLDDVVPRRAVSVIRAVNHPSAGKVRPVVITCRTDRYHQLSGRFDAAQTRPAVQEATPTAGRRGPGGP